MCIFRMFQASFSLDPAHILCTAKMKLRAMHLLRESPHGLPFHPLVSEVGSSVLEVGHAHCCKWGFQSAIKSIMANSVDPDEMSHLIRIYAVGLGVCVSLQG